MKERIVTYTREELKEKKGKTDFDRLRKTGDGDIRRQVENDPDSVIPTEEELQEFTSPAERRRKK